MKDVAVSRLLSSYALLVSHNFCLTINTQCSIKPTYLLSFKIAPKIMHGTAFCVIALRSLSGVRLKAQYACNLRARFRHHFIYFKAIE